MTNFSKRDLKVLAAIARSQTSASLDDISSRMGYRPARSGRLSVRKTLQKLLRKHGPVDAGYYGESSKYVGRLPPKDQWDNEKWFLTPAAHAALTSHNRSQGE